MRAACDKCETNLVRVRCSAVPASWTTIRYRDGLGASRRTLVELTLWNDRHVRLTFTTGAKAERSIVDGLLEEWVFPELGSLLSDAGFPDFPQSQDRGGHATALLSAATGTATVKTWIRPEHRQLASILLLEAVASALSDGALPAYKPLERPVLSASPVVR